MDKLWVEYCPNCKKETKFRWLDCEECKAKRITCNMVICIECGDGYNREVEA